MASNRDRLVSVEGSIPVAGIGKTLAGSLYLRANGDGQVEVRVVGERMADGATPWADTITVSMVSLRRALASLAGATSIPE